MLEVREEKSQKPLLPFKSCHPKAIKRGIVTSLLKNAIAKTCIHQIEKATTTTLHRLLDAGFNDDIINEVMRSLSKGKKEAKKVADGSSRRVVLPFYHGVSHNIKAMAQKFGVSTVYRNDIRLSRLTPFIKEKNGTCQITHKEMTVPCKSGVVYSIPMTCGLNYIGQTGRCLNIRLNEHKNNVKNNAPNSEVAKHIDQCSGCVPEWKKSTVLEFERNDKKRLILETLQINNSKNCISNASVVFSDIEKRFLDV